MAYNIVFTFTAPPGSTLEAQLLDSIGQNVGSLITSGYVERGNSWYMWAFSVPDNHVGAVEIRDTTTDAVYILGSINPQEIEKSKIDLTQSVPIENLTSKTTQNIADCLSAARADGAGRWTLTIDGSNRYLNYYGPGNVLVRQFLIDDIDNPTSRT